jgi:hypothetical protein
MYAETGTVLRNNDAGIINVTNSYERVLFDPRHFDYILTDDFVEFTRWPGNLSVAQHIKLISRKSSFG